jgi:hypothetical protein
MKTQFFNGCTTIEEVKKRYKELAVLHHPDKGGDLRTMQELNAEYQRIIKSNQFEFKTEEEREDCLIYPDVINKLILIDGIIIEIIGRWVWVSGNTYAHRAELKEIGLFFAPKKMMWYYRPPHEKSPNHKPMDIEKIRAKYGSDLIETKKESKRELTEV